MCQEWNYMLKQNFFKMKDLYELSYRTNVNVYNSGGRSFVIYDDHRTLLNVIFEARKSGYFTKIPNLIFFDFHDDACKSFTKSEILKKIGVEKVSDITSKQFWNFVEFDLNPLDDNWLLTGMELNMIQNSILIGAEQINNIQELENLYTSEDEIEHQLYTIPHLEYSLGRRGCLGDSMIKEPYYQSVREILQYDNYSFNSGNVYPFILDFDLDCFTTECCSKRYAWPERIFKEKYVNNATVYSFVKNLIRRSSIITICREPDCCGGIGESNKILSYLDCYLFDGVLKTSPII